MDERHYGALQDLNKEGTTEEYGAEQVKIWRRSFDVQPPVLDPEDKRNPVFDPTYRNISKDQLPLTENLKETITRVAPYFEEIIKPEIETGKRVLIAAHGNSIRAFVKYFKNLSSDEILEVNIPTGMPLVYEFNNELRYLINTI